MSADERLLYLQGEPVVFSTKEAINSRSPSSLRAERAWTGSNHLESRSQASGQVLSCRLTLKAKTRTSHETLNWFSSKRFS